MSRIRVLLVRDQIIPTPLEVERKQYVTVVLQRAITLFGITQNPHLLSLFRLDGSVIPENETLECAGLKPGEVLLLRPNAVKGGGGAPRLAREVVRETFRVLRECGRRECECAVYWTGPAFDDLGTATTVGEGEALADLGVDAVVAQGAEAGAHRGTFSAPFEIAMVPTLELVRGIAPFAPVIASGGIMDGRDIRRMLDNGASAAQLGTAFLPCPESGASACYKQALLAAKTDTTVMTRAFSGRPARGLRNEFIINLEGREDVIFPYPLQNILTRSMRTAAGQLGNAGFVSLWAGQGVARCRTMPAGDLVKQLILELAKGAAK